jgi:FkbM family methyltransferase
MLSTVSNFIKRNPTLHDLVFACRRKLKTDRTGLYSALDRFSRGRNRTVNFIQVGASDGLRNDPIREFVVRDHWRGVFVEPLPGVFEILKFNYRKTAAKRQLKFVNCAVSSEPGSTLKLWSFCDELLKKLPLEQRLRLLRKSSLERKHVEKYLGSHSPEMIQAINVECLTFSELLQKHFPSDWKLDLLVLDVEGRELELIGSIDFDSNCPSAILYESIHLDADSDRLRHCLENQGYCITRYGRDDWAVLDSTNTAFRCGMSGPETEEATRS